MHWNENSKNENFEVTPPACCDDARQQRCVPISFMYFSHSHKSTLHKCVRSYIYAQNSDSIHYWYWGKDRNPIHSPKNEQLLYKS